MERISSENNQRIKRLALLERQAKARRKEQSFVIEGRRIVEDAPREAILEIYVSESYAKEMDVDPREKADSLVKEHPAYLLSDAVFRRVADTETPQGILALAREPAWQLEDLLHKEEMEQDQRADLLYREETGREQNIRQSGGRKGNSAPLLLLLEDIQDPGNLGTMFRTAEAAGATGIIMTRGCVDLFNPKTVRATMSSIFRLPFLVTENAPGMLETLHGRGIQTFAAALDGSISYETGDYTGGTAFLIGNEGNGLKAETIQAADQRIRIPMEGKIESLNAAMSAGILLYEAHRQRMAALHGSSFN